MSTHFRQPSPAPGREAPGSAQTSQDANPPAKDAGSSSGGGGIFGSQWAMLLMVFPILLMLLMSRNQSKKQKQIESSLKVGDKVVTQAGLLGRINEMDERLVKLEIAPGVKVEVLKSTVQGKYAPVESKPDPKADAKADAAKDERAAQEKKA